MGQPQDGAATAPTLDSFGAEIGRGQARTIRARWELQTVTRVREAIALDLAAREVSEQVIGEAELVVTELVTNSLRHARRSPTGPCASTGRPAATTSRSR
ncbi:hypothetical protein [Janibacter indicus]|uniref:hypothetical protein n=1 Tax=Janibacter indicus TaxID=857417 RepID=UPI003D9A7E3E